MLLDKIKKILAWFKSDDYTPFHPEIKREADSTADEKDRIVNISDISYIYDGTMPGPSIPPREIATVSLYGTAAGDIFGSSREGVPPEHSSDYRTDDLLVHGRYTDDTALTKAVYDVLASVREDDINKISDDEIVRRFSGAYKAMVKKHKNLPYGGRFYEWAFSDDMIAKYDSFGDGAPMRAAVIGAFLCDQTQETVQRVARLSAMPSHWHPDAIKATTITAMMAYLAANGVTRKEVARYGARFYTRDRLSTARFRSAKPYASTECTIEDLVSGKYVTNDMSCDTAMSLAIIALRDNETYEDCLRSVLRYQGDTDTIMAIAGGIYSILEAEAGKKTILQGKTLEEIWQQYTKNL